MKNLVFLLFFLTCQIGISQTDDCFADMDGNVYSNPQTMDVYYCVNLYFHIVRRSNGTGGVPTSRIQDVMNQLDNAFNPLNIQFNNSGYQYLNADAAYNDTAPFTNTVGLNGQGDRIDIYLYPEDNNCSGGAAYCSATTKTGIGLGGKLRYTGWVVSQSFAAHEMGHILGLQHTFRPEDHPVPSDYELINGTNCSFTADRFCDTPASFQGDSPHPCGSSMVNLGVNFEVSSNCVWLNPKQEPSTGLYYTPDLNNYMEYTHPNCMTNFC